MRSIAAHIMDILFSYITMSNCPIERIALTITLYAFKFLKSRLGLTMVMVNMIGRGREASDGSNYIRTLDALIIGGAAGPAAAIYLSRFRRKVQVIDANQSSLLLIPTTHNYPGYPEGINGPDLLQRLRMQALRYGSQLIRSRPNELSGIK